MIRAGNKTMKVFISYAREDSGIAKKLYHDLKQAGIIPWMDMEDLLPGQTWELEIDKAIEESSYFLMLLSSNSVTKQGVVQKEVRKALDRFGKFTPGETYIIPARLDDCEPKYKELHALHWADLFPSYEYGLNKILRVLAPNHRPEIATQRNNAPEKPVEAAPIINTTPEKKPAPPPQAPKSKYQLRKEPMTVSEKDAQSKFKLNDKWRPLEYMKNEFEDKGDTVTDHATGLMWQKSGSPDRKYLKDVPAYIEQLNSEKFDGYDDWRLPTVDELKSLLTQGRQSNDFFINPLFDKKQWWCWTSDKRASGDAWRVYFNYGLVYWYKGNLGYVRAVRSGQ